MNQDHAELRRPQRQPHSDTASLDADIQRRCLSALCDADARRIVIGLAVFSVAVFTPLALNTRSGWQIAALLALVMASVLRWVTSWQLEKQLSAADVPTVWPIWLVANGITGLCWALAATVTMLAPALDHGGAIVMTATAAVCAAGLWSLAAHRHASRAFLAPMALLPLVAAFQPGAFALGLALVLAAAVAAFIVAAEHAEQSFVARCAQELKLRNTSAKLQKLLREHVAALDGVAARDEDRNLLFEHAAVGLAAVADRKIQRINLHLARQLNQPPEALVGKDVLHLVAREHRDAVDALAKVKDPARGSLEISLNLGTATEGGTVEIVTPPADAGSRLWVFNPVRVSAAKKEDGKAADASRVLDRRALKDMLAQCAANAANATELAFVVIALQGWRGLVDEHGHSEAESLQAAITERLRAICRTHDRIAQLEGESFVMILTADFSEAQLQELCVRIRATLEAPYNLAGQSLRLRTGVEPVLCRLDTQQPGTVLALVDEALHQAHKQHAGDERFSGNSSGKGGSNNVVSISSNQPLAPRRAEPGPDAAVKSLRAPLPAPKVEAPVTVDLITLVESEEGAGPERAVVSGAIGVPGAA